MQEFRRSVWIGWIFTLLAGTLLHFLYGWSQENRVVSLYAAVNESTWEHLKLLFFPALGYTIWEYIWIGHRHPGYVWVRFQATALGMLTIVTLFYTYTGIIGRHFLAADLAVFVIGAGVTAWYTWRNVPKHRGKNLAGGLLFAGVSICFGVFTFWQPALALFQSA